MSKPFCYLCFLFILLIPLSSLGATKNVTITWTMTDTTDVTGYKMYYSYDSNMTAKKLACETTNASDTSLTCTGVDLQQSPVFFSIAAVKTTGESLSPVTAQTFSDISAPAPVQDFRIETAPAASASTTGPKYAINFQPADVAAPDGFQVDSGLSFDTNRGYGWISGPASDGVRDRDNSDSPDQAYDTIIHVKPTSRWEIAVPNGDYTVTICNGDASYPSGIQNVQAEGVTVIDNVALSSTSPWVERTATVTVADGKLSVTFTDSTDPARLCWMKVTSTP